MNFYESALYSLGIFKMNYYKWYIISLKLGRKKKLVLGIKGNINVGWNIYFFMVRESNRVYRLL